MKFTRWLVLMSIVAVSVFAQAAQPDASTDKFETRCGWLDNPTPGNFSLYDRDAEWIIGTQGAHQVEGDWEAPNFASGQWIETNGSYGYGCACLQASVNSKTLEVVKIKSSRAMPLTSCRRDPALKKWKALFK